MNAPVWLTPPQKYFPVQESLKDSVRTISQAEEFRLARLEQNHIDAVTRGETRDEDFYAWRQKRLDQMRNWKIKRNIKKLEAKCQLPKP